LVARFVRDEEAVGSNPATPTQHIRAFQMFRSGLLSRRVSAASGPDASQHGLVRCDHGLDRRQAIRRRQSVHLVERQIGYWGVPPLTSRLWPLTHEARSDARCSAALATGALACATWS
jgi:hypothetical protein